MSLTYRAVKGSKLTIEEGDENFEYLYAPHNNYYDVTSASVTTPLVMDTWKKLNTSTTEGYEEGGLVHTNNRITATGAHPVTGDPQTRLYRIDGSVSVESGNSNIIHFAIFKNGLIVAESEQETTMSSAGKGSNISFQCVIELEPADYIEVWVKNEAATTDVTLSKLNVFIQGLQYTDPVS